LGDNFNIPGPGLVLHEFHCAFHTAFTLHSLFSGGMPARKCQKALHDLLAALRAPVDHVQAPLLFGMPGCLRQQLGKSHN
jgi:hypothetical protein